MTRYLMLFFPCFILVFFSCGNDDGGNTGGGGIELNTPPEIFSLQSPQDGSIDIDRIVTLSWQAATDIDNDPVVYDVFFGENESNLPLLETNINATSFSINSPLDASATYFWKVIAKDGNGGATESNVFSLTTKGLGMSKMGFATFGGRYTHEAIAFQDKLWIFGGKKVENIQTLCGDIQQSIDGVNWTATATQNIFTARQFPGLAIFQDKLWVIGGYDSTASLKSDVWSSSDGVNWTEVTANANFTGRWEHQVVAFQNKLWVIGGNDENGDNLADVWSSTDGMNWTKEVDAAPFGPVVSGTLTVFQNKLWMIGGWDGNNYDNDVWNSVDGVNWEQVSTNTVFQAKLGHTATVFDGELWVTGGLGRSDIDIWKSANGIDWEKQSFEGEMPSDRWHHAAAVHNGALWIFSGSKTNGGNEAIDDIWRVF